ncbi:hypothetical protein CPS_1936 [Colwellia psychrerythraea 34H]|uniref:Uncharacterized protein n=1 Tax=Colwellia psychrerythraea (strain 34H / ATCC BAA-681) TaxID=167879 RepID=Q483V0_COLP3|nr:hypothetical protein CPS_1936 [Colwellia psychrerythraea 34H]
MSYLLAGFTVRALRLANFQAWDNGYDIDLSYVKVINNF